MPDATEPGKEKGFSPGKHAIVSLERSDSGVIVRKELGARFGLGPVEAEQVRNDWMHYRQLLQSDEWTIPTLFGTQIAGRRNSCVIVTSEEFIGGGDMSRYFEACRNWDDVLSGILAVVSCVCTAVARQGRQYGEGRALSYGVDVKPDNFVFRDGVAVLVDTFRPMISGHQGSTIHSVDAVSSIRRLPGQDHFFTSPSGMMVRFCRHAMKSIDSGGFLVGERLPEVIVRKLSLNTEIASAIWGFRFATTTRGYGRCRM